MFRLDSRGISLVSRIPIYLGVSVFALSLLLFSLTSWQRLEAPKQAEILQGEPASYPITPPDFGLAIKFTQPGNYIYTNLLSQIYQSNFSIEAWINPSPETISSPGTHYIAAYTTNGAGGYWLSITNGRPAFTLYINGDSGGGIVELIGETQLSADRWYHITGSRYDRVYLYLDGVVDADPQAIPPFIERSSQETAFSVGCRLEQPSHVCQGQFFGEIDEVRVSKQVLPTQGFTPPSSPLVPKDEDQLIWRFDDDARDYSRFNRGGAMVGTALFVPSTISTPAPTTSPLQRADVNKDNWINLGDIVRVLARWGRVDCNCDEDTNPDGIVNLRDIQLILVFWGRPIITPSASPSTAEQQACMIQSPIGTSFEEKWHQFPDGCADYCGVGPVCTQVLTVSCDCGPDECWDRNSFTCQPNCVQEGGRAGWSESEGYNFVCCPGLTQIDGMVILNSQGECESLSGFELMSVCTYCGNGQCGLGENYCNCPQDCPAP